PSARSLGRCHPDQEKPTILVSLEHRSALRLQRRSLLRVCDVTARKSPPDDCPWKTMCHYSSTSTVVHWRQPALSSVRRHRHYGPWPGHQRRLYPLCTGSKNVVKENTRCARLYRHSDCDLVIAHPESCDPP